MTVYPEDASAGCADHVPGHGFRAVDDGFRGFIEDEPDGFHFHGIADRSGRSVRVDVSDIFRFEVCHAECFAHEVRAGFGIGDNHVGRIAVCGKAGKDRLGLVAAGKCAGFAFENQNAGSFAENESVALLVERTACSVRCVVVGVRESAHGVESERLFPADLFGAADHDDVIFPGHGKPAA